MGSRRLGRRWIPVTAVLVLALTSCGSLGAERATSPDPEPAPTSPTAPATSSPRPTNEPEDPPTEAPPELRFTAPAVEGGTIEGADYAGRDLVIWFWAPW